MAIIESYKTGDYPFPNSDTTKEEKNKPKYSLQSIQAIYSRHVRNRTGITYSYSSFFGELRKYGRGLQSENKYKRFLTSAAGSTGTSAAQDVDGVWTQNMEYERKGWMNVLWDIISPAGKIRSMIQGLLDDIDFDVMADAIDADSGAQEEDKKWRLWATTRAEIRRGLDELKVGAGLPLDRPEFVPDSLEELEMYQSAGGFKMGYAMAMEKLIKHTGDISNWDATLKPKFIDDLIDLNIIFAKSYIDDTADKEKWRYVDPEDLVIQYSKYEDFRDAEYAGEFRDMKISQIRQSLLQAGYSEEQIRDVAKLYSGQLGNPSIDNWKEYNVNVAGAWRYDDFNVRIFEGEWIDSNKTRRVKYTNKYGKVRFIDYENEDGSPKKKKLGKREVLVSSTKKALYGCKWVIGSDMVWDYGLVFYQPKPNAKNIQLTYKGIKIPGKSLSQTLIPIYDNIQIGWLKYQNSMSVIFEEGYAVDWGMMQHISDGDKKFTPLEAIRMWKETGILPFRSTAVGDIYRGGSSVPVHKLPGGMGESLNQAIGRLQIQFKLIEDLTGLSPVSLGAQADPNAPVATTEMSLRSTHNALKPMIRGLFNLKDSLAKISSIRIQQLLMYDDESRKEYEKVIGASDVEAVITAKGSSVEYGIKLEARPTADEKMQMLRAAEIALQPGRDGIPGISFEDWTYVLERINSGGNLKEIRLYLANAKKKAQQQGFQEKQALIQQQAEANMQMKQADIESQQMTKKLDVQGQIAIDNNEHRNKMEQETLKANADYMSDLSKQVVAEQTAGV